MTILGIDLGTTNIKITFIDDSDHVIHLTSSKPTNAYIDKNSPCQEQKVSAIYECLANMLRDTNTELLKTVNSLVITGQMHGVVFWQTSECGDKFQTSNLITWEDRRCDKNFLDRLPKSDSCGRISSGYGCATIFWFVQNDPNYLQLWNCAGTIADNLVAYLGDLNRPVMCPQNAASWGYFNSTKMEWETALLSEAGFPIHLLPDIVQTGSKVGHIKSSKLGLPSGVSIYVALGDLQASVFCGIRHNLGKAVMNIGTASQLVLPVELSNSLPADLPPALTLLPYFGLDRRLAVVASLNGGNVLSHFVHVLTSWCQELGANVENENSIWMRLQKAVDCLEPNETNEAIRLRVRATLFGERHLNEAQCCAAVEGLIPGHSLRLGVIYKALCRGLMDNLLEMMQPEILDHCNVKGVIGVGSTLRRNRVLLSAFYETFSRWSPCVQDGELDASYGAALSVVQDLCK